MDPSKLRPLLPAPSPDTPDGRVVLASRSLVRGLPKKRSAVSAACGSCRRRKGKCDGVRPKCQPCKDRGHECEYDRNPDESQINALKRRIEELQELQTLQTPSERLIQQLRDRSQDDAGTILQRIRAGQDYKDILLDLQDADLMLQTSLVPETRFRYEFPVSTSIPVYLLKHTSPYLGSIIYEWTSPTPDGLSRSSSALQTADRESSAWLAPYLKPYHAAQIIDEQLGSVIPSKWTTVCSDNALMRKLLHSFFLQDHDWWTVFHKDYFLDDMAGMRRDFCSPLLVNALLALSCNYYRGLSNRTEFWNPVTLGYRFLAEARRLHEYEQGKDSLTNMQAHLVFHIIYSGAGSDTIGFANFIQAVAMAHKMGLFRPASPGMDRRQVHVRAYMAWSLYSWQSLICFGYMRPPLISQPPDIPLPDPEKHLHWYGEIWLKYPSSERLYSSSSGGVFKARAEFAVIQSEVSAKFFSESASKPSVAEIAELYSKLKIWQGSLVDPLSPRKALLPSHLKLHMHYYQVVNKLLQSPTLACEENLDIRSNLIKLFGQLPMELVLNAQASLEILLRAYYLRHGFDYLDAYLVAVLMESCLAAIISINQESRKADAAALQSSIILLAKGIHEQGQNLFLGQLVFQLVEGKMRPQEVEMMKYFIRHDPEAMSNTFAMSQIQMEWPVDVHSVEDDPDVKRLGDLVQQLKTSSRTPG